jgi:DNA polymerase-1
MVKTVIFNLTDFENWVDQLDYMQPLVIDTETTGLKWYSLDVVGFSLCDGKRACYVVIQNKEDYKLYGNILSQVINRCSEIIMHNSSFDLAVLKKMGVDYLKINNIFDTMIGAHLLNENKSSALKELAKRVLKVPEDQIKTYEGAISYGQTSDIFYNYATNDAIWTYELYQIEKPLITRQSLDYVFYKIEMPFQKVLAEMNINGFRVDLDKAHKMAEFVSKLKVNTQIELCKSAGLSYEIQQLIDGDIEVVSVNFNSSDQMIKIIENNLGLEITEKTKPSKRFPDGKKSVGKKTFKRLKGKHEFIDILQKYKGLEKLYNSFLIPIDKFVDGDGKVRCSLNDLAVTYRVRCSEPNLEQLPNPLKTPLPVNYRDIFLPEEGNVLIVTDYSGQELRGLTEVSQDKDLIESFAKDKDIHLATANYILKLGIPKEALCTSHPDYKKYKEEFSKQRDIIKNTVVFPLIYGKTAYGMSLELGISENEAQKMIDGFLDLYPSVRKAIDDCSVFLDKHRFVRNKHGLKRRLTPGVAKSYRQAFNFLIQSLGADQLKLACASCQKLKYIYPEWGLKLVLPVHDEIIFEVKKEFSQVASEHIKKRMENCMEISVPSIAEIKVVSHYGEAK